MQISRPYVGADENNGLHMWSADKNTIYTPHIVCMCISCMLLVSWALWPCFTYSIWVFGGLPRSLSLVLFTVLGQSEIQLGASNGMTRIENGPILLSVLKMSRTRTHTRTHTHSFTHTFHISTDSWKSCCCCCFLQRHRWGAATRQA